MTAAIILAAGASRRFGHANKLLSEHNGKPLIVHTIQAVSRQACPVFVVVGQQSERVAAALRTGGCGHVHLIMNPHWRQGMASSLRTGLQALPTCFGRAWLCLGDMPHIDRLNWRQLQGRHKPGIDYVRPLANGVPGHPVLLSRTLFADLQTINGDQGAKHILEAVPTSRRCLLEMGTQCLHDVDTPAASRHLQFQPMASA